MDAMTIPAVSDLSAELRALNLKQIDALAALSGVPAPTLVKIRNGHTLNPGLETVRKFLPHLGAAKGGGAQSTTAD